ncbi:MAG: ABC-F family ATP-binding cassette domain-containing protein [Candidatus Omnitrophica bacterium]|jgi:ATP-binding cassette subfamily F protein 3|nr:ABC-F family ATP-binding cassette domain-containing protein [Candidatus Omnitrophota bacterium]
MRQIITINSLAKTHGRKTLFSEVSLNISEGEKVGLVGPNGSGKTSLFRLILKKEEPSSGDIQIGKNIRIGYLPQEAEFKSESKVLQEVIEGDETIRYLAKEKELLEEKHETLSNRYGDILHQLEFMGFFDLEHRAEKVLMGLGFTKESINKKANQLSGGWQMRILLARLLVCHYELLLLDEPTNFLDLDATLWLKDYLKSFKGTYLIISHDKDFLKEVTNYVLVLEDGLLTKVKGAYENYQQEKDRQRNTCLKQFSEQEKKRQQLEDFISRFHAQPNKASQVRAKKRVLEKMEKIIVPGERRASIRNFSFPKPERGGYTAMELKNISKSYGSIEVYRNFNFEVTRQERAVLVGENGAGKSTLLKIMAGVINIDSGERILGHNTNIGYLSQTHLDVLNPENTIIEEASLVASAKMSTETIRTILSMFLFVADDIEKKVKILSGGEKCRLILAKLLINPPNLLLLDEPTTHLDIDAVDALVGALTNYEGTVIFISHDLHFVRSIANVVYEVKSGQVRKFPGNFDYYYQKKNKGEIAPDTPKDKDYQTDNFQNDKSASLDNKSISVEEHNAQLVKRIKKLRKKRKELKLEHYVKKRIVSNSRHGEDIIQKYRKLLDEINRQIEDIDKKIAETKTKFLT